MVNSCENLAQPMTGVGRWRCIEGTNLNAVYGAVGRLIDPSWGGHIELFLVPASDPRLV